MIHFVLGGLLVLLGLVVGYLTRPVPEAPALQQSAAVESVAPAATPVAEAEPAPRRESEPVLTLEAPPAATTPAPPREVAVPGTAPRRVRPPQSAGARPATVARRPTAEPTVNPEVAGSPPPMSPSLGAPVTSPPPLPPPFPAPVASPLPMSARDAATVASPWPMPLAAPAVATGPEPADIAITPAVTDRGRRLLSGEEGRFPMIVAHYRHTLGFEGYARAVRSFGGRFFVRDLDARTLRAEIDVTAGRLVSSVDVARLAATMSPLSRDLSDEPALTRFTWDAERTHGRARYAVVLLIPAAIDAAVLGAVDAALRAAGRAPHEFLAVEGEYRHRGRDLVLEFSSARGRGGEVLPLRVAVNLSRLP